MNTTKAVSYDQINAVKCLKDFHSIQPEPAIHTGQGVTAEV